MRRCDFNDLGVIPDVRIIHAIDNHARLESASPNCIIIEDFLWGNERGETERGARKE